MAIRRVPPLVIGAALLWIGLFAIGLWTGDRPVMAVAVAGALASVLAWWVSS